MDRNCDCGSELPREAVYDARNIFVFYCCEECESKKRKKYRADIFTNPDYWAAEQIEEDC